MTIPAPNACRHCGIDEHAHGRRWSEAAGWHQWVAPDDAMRLERMRARRNEHLAAKLRRLREIPADNIAAREALMAPDPTHPFRVNTNA